MLQSKFAGVSDLRNSSLSFSRHSSMSIPTVLWACCIRSFFSIDLQFSCRFIFHCRIRFLLELKISDPLIFNSFPPVSSPNPWQPTSQKSLYNCPSVRTLRVIPQHAQNISHWECLLPHDRPNILCFLDVIFVQSDYLTVPQILHIQWVFRKRTKKYSSRREPTGKSLREERREKEEEEEGSEPTSWIAHSHGLSDSQLGFFISFSSLLCSALSCSLRRTSSWDDSHILEFFRNIKRFDVHCSLYRKRKSSREWSSEKKKN